MTFGELLLTAFMVGAIIATVGMVVGGAVWAVCWLVFPGALTRYHHWRAQRITAARRQLKEKP